jgi:RNA polymerase sigma factor (sigma-70 family)
MKTNELLRRYVAGQSETAFAELVRQHIALVYSAALRQVNGDVPAAQDVTQAVFTDLARKAPGLTSHPSLTGWLYTSTRYQAAKARRAEQSRRSHEQEAHEMNQLLQSTDADTTWQELRPMLDDAMHDLSATDREAVLLRYFERLPLAEIGARLGLTDKAAHMRVERAIDRLRAALAKRGVTSTVTALAVALAARAVGSVPAGLAAQVSHAAVATVAAGGALGWGLLKLAALIKGQALVAAGVVLLLAGVIFVPQLWEKSRGTTSNQSAAPIASAAVNGNAAKPASAAKTARSDVMVLHIVADDTGQPIPGAAIYSPGVSAAQRSGRGPGANLPPPAKIAVADEHGVCEIPIPRQLAFFSGTDGFVDELVSWSPVDGNTVPSQYTLRLKRAASIGGLAADEEGKPVAGVGIEFENLTRFEPRDESNPESPTIAYYVGYPTPDDSPTAVTDATGHWHIARFAREDIGHMMIHATCPGYIVKPPSVASFPLLRGAGPEVEKQLLAGTYPFTLIRSLPISGVIVDMNGDPVREAIVRIGNSTELGRSNPHLHTTTTNQADGTFEITGCIPGTNQVTVVAPKFARTTQEVNLTSDTAPLRLVLQPGKVLRLRVLDSNGLPPAKARVRVTSSLGTLLTPILDSDADGRVVWESSPEGELQIAVVIQGMATVATNLLVQANGEEHLVTLPPTAPTSASSRAAQQTAVSGTVTDAATRLPIPRFRVIRGARYFVNGVTYINWNMGTVFYDGKFRYGSDIITSAGPFCLKFEAEGYAPFVTRSVRDDKREVTLDIVLQPAVSNSIIVLSSDGRPAVDADIGLEMPGTPLTLSPGALWHPTSDANVNVSRTDEQGRVALPPDDSVVGVIAVNEDGYGEATSAALAAQPTLRLQPWGRLEGDYLVGGKPAAGRALVLENNKTPESLKLDGRDYSATTDADGHFSFAKVPPGQFQLFKTDAVVHSGQTTTMTLRANAVSARLRWPEGVQRQTNWSFRVYCSANRFSETSEGIWTAELPAGADKAYAYVDSRLATGSSLTLFHGEALITVPADPVSGTLDLGEIVLQPVP